MTEGVSGLSNAAVVGIGTDLVDVDRFRTVLRRRPSVAVRLFTAGERTYAERAIDPAARLAARFAAKEAVMKALGTGARSVAWRDIEVLPDQRGKPLVYLTGGAARRAEVIGLDAIDISLSHLDEFAIAVVVCSQERREQEPEAARSRLVNFLRLRGLLG